jgi:N4-(beta-N-acetylglucosaminyl)-L-asparaginase
MNLLTEKARTAWLAWKASIAENWRPGLDSPEWKEKLAALLDTPEKLGWREWIHEVVTNPPTGTIPCFALNEKGEISGVVSTSGLAWKIAGRVGDSPIIGAGQFVDNDVGAAGSTGRGEENIKISGGHTIVELMRKGMHPREACLEALRRIARNYNNDMARLSKFSILFYALNKDGAHGGASLWSKSRSGRPRTYAVHDGTAARSVECAALFEGNFG